MALLNLARDPFVNTKPLQRICAMLSVVAVVLLLINGVLFWRYLSGSAGLRGQLRDIRAEIATEKQAIDALRSQVTGYDLQSQNQQTEFLNYQIRQRTFGWSLLFERLGEVLPNRVKISTLSPSIGGDVRGRRDEESDSDIVELMMRGTSADDENLLDFIDRLFAHPAFGSPRLLSEIRSDGGEIGFELSASYLPMSVLDGAEGEGTATEVSPEAAPGEADPQSGERYTQETSPNDSQDDPALTSIEDGGFAGEPRVGATAADGSGAAPPRPASLREATDPGTEISDTGTPGSELRPPDDFASEAEVEVEDPRTAPGQRRVRPRPTTRGSAFQPGRSQPARSDNPAGQPRTTRPIPTRSQPGVTGVPVQPTRNASSPGGGR